MKIKATIEQHVQGREWKDVELTLDINPAQLFSGPDFAEAVRRLLAGEGKAPEVPPVENNLARAQEFHHQLIKAGKCFPTLVEWDMLYDYFMDAIRERDEKAAQMMTVEDAAAWRKAWHFDDDDSTFEEYAACRIKERNDADKAGK